MKAFYLTVMVLQFGLLVFVIDTEETKITKLEQTIAAMDRTAVASDDMIEGLLVRNDELSGVNEALMTYATPASCIRAIKHTPLPKMKDSK